jgi:hypothetical protein
MIPVVLALLAADPPPLSLEPFMNERAAGSALEGHLACLARGDFERRNDPRDANAIAADVVSGCREKAAILRAFLTDIYRRKPALLPAGTSPDKAAAAYVSEMDGREASLILETRKHK